MTIHPSPPPSPSPAPLLRRLARLGRRLRHPAWARRWAARRGLCPPGNDGWTASVRRRLRRTVGVDVHRVRPAGQPLLTRSTLDFELDQDFARLIDHAVDRAGSGPRGEGVGPFRQRQRLYNLLQLPGLTRGVPGVVVECGTYRGLSAYLFCQALREEDPAYTGKGFHVFDSFEGISGPTAEDRAGDPRIPSGKSRHAGMFQAGADVVRATLSDFPDVELHPGWIPESLAGFAEPARFVYLDLDVHEPTKAALAHFYPLLSPGGALLCDDYGSIRWPGVTAAVEEFCAGTAFDGRLLRLSTGQALLLRPWGGTGRPTT